jgi:hypothetical protein
MASILHLARSYLNTPSGIRLESKEHPACHCRADIRCSRSAHPIHHQHHLLDAPSSITTPHPRLASRVLHCLQVPLRSYRHDLDHGHLRHSPKLLHSRSDYQRPGSQASTLRLDVPRICSHATTSSYCPLAPHPLFTTRSIRHRSPPHKSHRPARQHRPSLSRRLVPLRKHVCTACPALATAAQLLGQRRFLHVQLLRRDPDGPHVRNPAC